jgi:hypothetical protein
MKLLFSNDALVRLVNNGRDLLQHHFCLGGGGGPTLRDCAVPELGTKFSHDILPSRDQSPGSRGYRLFLLGYQFSGEIKGLFSEVGNGDPVFRGKYDEMRSDGGEGVEGLFEIFQIGMKVPVD